MEKVKKEYKNISWKNVLIIFLAGFVGSIIGMYFTIKNLYLFIRFL